jgi:NAD(P)-dependent dehydrogenase (short-subunit alcohol dehydrogenase family)
MATERIILVLGAGGNVGSQVAKRFASEGYKVAVASRRGTSPEPSYLAIKANLSAPKTVEGVFEQVKKEFGSPPNIVVYNGESIASKEGRLPISVRF